MYSCKVLIIISVKKIPVRLPCLGGPINYQQLFSFPFDFHSPSNFLLHLQLSGPIITMSETENRPLGPQPDILRIQQYHHGLGDEMQKFMNTPQFDTSNIVSNTLQQLNATVQELSKVVKGMDTRLTQMDTRLTQMDTRLTQTDTKIDTVIQSISGFETQQKAR
jgi:hypothetical protein